MIYKRPLLFDVLLIIVSTFLLGMGTHVFAQSKVDNPPEDPLPKKIAALSATPIYNLDNEQLQSILTPFLQDNPSVKALQIFETIDNDVMLQFYREENKLIFGRSIPDKFQNLNHFKEKSFYENELVGIIEVYIKIEKAEHEDLKLTDKEKKWVHENPITRIATLKSWPPYDITLEDGSHTGLHKELLDLINQAIGTNLQLIIFDTWSEAYQKAISGETHAIIGLSWTKERSKSFNFSPAYHYDPAELVISAGNTTIKKWSDLNGKTILVRKSSSLKSKIQKDLKNINIIDYESEKTALMALVKGEGDAFLSWISSNQDELEKLGLKVVFRVDTRQGEFTIGSHVSYPILNSIISKGIKSIPLTKMSQLREKWSQSGGKDSAEIKVKLTSEEVIFLKAHPVLKAFNEKDWPPFDYFEYGMPQGLSVDYIDLIAELIGVKIEWITGPSWSESLKMIEGKELDIMPNIIKTPDREKYILYTPPYIRNPNIIISTTKAPFTSLKELEGKTVAVPKGFYQEEILNRSFPKIKLLIVKDALAGLKAVSFGKADATMGEKAVLDYIINRNLLTGLITSGEIEIGNKELPNLRIGIRKDWPLLKSIIAKAMAQITPQQMSQIQKKWIVPVTTSPNLPIKTDQDSSKNYLVSIAGIFIAIGAILILITWLVSRSQKRDITELYNSKDLKRAGLAIITLSIIVIILIASFRLIQFKEDFQNELQDRLQTTLNTSHHSLKIWIEGKKSELRMISKNTDLTEIVESLLSIPKQNKTIVKSKPLNHLRTFFNTNLNIFDNANMYVVSKDMRIIGSSEDKDIGKQIALKKHQDHLQNNLLMGKTTMIPPIATNFYSDNSTAKSTAQKPQLFFASPINNAHGVLIAALLLELDSLKEFSLIARSGQFGKTGETYIFNNQGFLLTESRFNQELQDIGLINSQQNSTLNVKITDPGIHLTKENINQVDFDNLNLTLMAQNAISGSNGSNMLGYRDYRGVTVVGAWYWDKHLNIGITSEIDWYEAYLQYTTMRNTLVITLAITILIAISLTGFTLWIGQSATRSLARSRDQLELRVQKRTAELQRIEKRFRDLLESAPDSMIIVDEKGTISLINAQTEKLFGYQREELYGKEIEMVIPTRFREDHPEKRNQFTKQAMSMPVEAKLELRGLRKNGEEFPVEVSLSPLKTDDGLLISAAVRDITERVLAEEALKESEEKNRLVLENVGEGIFGVDLNGKITFINTEGCTLLGYEKNELFGELIHGIIHHTRKNGSNYPVEECPMKKAYTEGKKFTINDEILWKKDGTAIDVVYTSAPIIKENNIEGAVITFRDVTEKRIAQGELKATQERFKAYFENSQVAMMITHPNKGLLEINNHLSEMLGYTFEELKQTNWAKITHPDDVDEDINNFEKVLSGETNGYTMDKRMLRKDGQTVYVNLSVSCVRKPDGTVDKFLASLLDITERKKMESALDFEKNQLQNIMDNSPIGAAISIDGFIRFANPKYLEMTGLSIGSEATDLYLNPQDRQELLAQLDRDGIVENRELQINSANKQPMDVLVTFIPIEYNNQHGILGWILDVTDQKAAEEKLRKNEEVLSRSQALAKIGGWEYEIQSEKIFWSDEVYNIHEMDKTKDRDWISESINCYQEKDREKIAHAFALAVSRGEPYDLALKFKTIKGRKRWVRSTGEPIYENGKLIRVAGNIADITRQKKIEAQLIASREEAEAATKAKSDFLANMSHEIRTPMNAIMGMTHLALQTDLTNKQKDYLSKVHTAATSLLGLINDILDFSKIEAGKLDMEAIDFNLDQVFNNVSTLIALKANEKGLEFLIQNATDIPRNLIGDPLRLGQILINLSNNAVKFTEKGEIVIQTKIIEENTNKVTLQFSVQDTGIGLTKKQIGNLFQSFSQADASTTRKFGGTGLGLTISKRLVEMMNGKIWVESEPGKGSSFIFTAELGRQAVKTDSPKALAKDLKGLRVLVTDDNETSRLIFEEILTSFGFIVEQAYTGGKALDALMTAKKPFDLVIMDWKMPGMSGIETSKQIKNQLNLPSIPKIIMCSSYGREEIMKKSSEAGLDGFLVKPVNSSILLDTILHVFGKSTDDSTRTTSSQSADFEGLKQILGARLLLVEDNEINQQVAQEILENAGFFVELAEDGQIAIEKVTKSPFDLVLMDIQMPVMDGYTATETIRKEKRFDKLPIIAMTANAMVGDREEAMNAGMNDHVAKPIDPQHLFATLIKWIEPGDRKIPEHYQKSQKKSMSDIEIPKNLPGINIGIGLKRVGGNERLYLDLLIKFHRDNQNIIKEITTALDKKDHELAQRLAHTIKGVSGNIGATDIQKAAESLEQSIKDEQLENSMDQLQALKEKLQIPMEQLAILSQTMLKDDSKATEKPQGEADQLKSFLMELEPFLNKRKPKPSKEIMEKINQFEWDDQYSGSIEDLSKFISKYKFKDAKTTSNEILKKMT